jgi:hypothetical protein
MSNHALLNLDKNFRINATCGCYFLTAEKIVSVQMVCNNYLPEVLTDDLEV